MEPRNLHPQGILEAPIPMDIPGNGHGMAMAMAVAMAVAVAMAMAMVMSKWAWTCPISASTFGPGRRSPGESLEVG